MNSELLASAVPTGAKSDGFWVRVHLGAVTLVMFIFMLTLLVKPF